jgi:hypothetical protein
MRAISVRATLHNCYLSSQIDPVIYNNRGAVQRSSVLFKYDVKKVA